MQCWKPWRKHGNCFRYLPTFIVTQKVTGKSVPEGGFGTWNVCLLAPAGTLDDREWDFDLVWKRKFQNTKLDFFTSNCFFFSALKARIWVDAYFVVILIDLILYLGFCIILPDHRTILSSMDNRTKPKVSFQIYSTKLWNHWLRNTILIKRSLIDM